MINKIKVTDLSDAESYAYGPKNDFDLWISTVDEEDRHKINRMNRLFDKKGIKHFHQFFADWSEDDGIKWDYLKQKGPQLHHIQNIITFLQPYVNDDKVHNLGINCFAGVSRSTALAIVAYVMSGLTPDQALTQLLKIRFGAWPNITILNLASKILAIDIVTPIKQWKKNALGSTDLVYPPEFDS